MFIGPAAATTHRKDAQVQVGWEAVLRIRIQIRIRRIHMFLGLPVPDPDPLVNGMDNAKIVRKTLIPTIL
jgi:hypothetical protein